MRDAPADRFPHIAALGDDLFSGTGEARLTWFFQVLVGGIVQTERP